MCFHEKAHSSAKLQHLTSDITDLISDSETLSFQELTEEINKLARQYFVQFIFETDGGNGF